MIFLQTSHIV